MKARENFLIDAILNVFRIVFEDNIFLMFLLTAKIKQSLVTLR